MTRFPACWINDTPSSPQVDSNMVMSQLTTVPYRGGSDIVSRTIMLYFPKLINQFNYTFCFNDHSSIIQQHDQWQITANSRTHESIGSFLLISSQEELQPFMLDSETEKPPFAFALHVANKGLSAMRFILIDSSINLLSINIHVMLLPRFIIIPLHAAL